MSNYTGARRAFSLIEVVIVAVILGIIAAICIPRMTHAGQTAAQSALAGEMAVWRNALDLYQNDHGGAYPKNSSTLIAQLTQYTDAAGTVCESKDAIHCFGPYLRSVPTLPLLDPSTTLAIPHGSNSVSSTLIGGAPSTIVSGGCGWLYDGAGNIYPNSGPLADSDGKLFNSY